MAHVIPLNRTAMLKLLAALVESDKRNSAMRAVTRQHSSELISKRQGEAAHSGVELPKIMVDPVQLQQVFMNLMLNAIEAMKDSGGELTVKSQLQDGQLQFSVSDTGVGCQGRRWIRSFLRSLPPSRRAAAWDWPSAIPLWSRMAAGCGPRPMMDEGQPFISPWRLI